MKTSLKAIYKCRDSFLPLVNEKVYFFFFHAETTKREI